MDRRVEIRPPSSSRFWVAGFSVAWCGLWIGLIVLSRGDVGGVAIPAGMLITGISLAYRLVRLSAVTEGGTFVLRNNLRTRQVTRAEVVGFRVGPVPNMPLARVIFVLLNDDSDVQVDAAMGLLPPGRRRIDGWLVELRDWLTQRETTAAKPTELLESEMHS